MTGKTLILGLGNLIFGDDGVGLKVAREIRKTWPQAPGIDIQEASLGGLALLDLIAGYDRVIIVDAIITKKNRPGYVYKLNLEDLGNVSDVYGSHVLDLRTVVELGKILGHKIPGTIHIYAVEIKDNTQFSEHLSPVIEEAIPLIAAQIINDLQ